jgi:MtfA peptidase
MFAKLWRELRTRRESAALERRAIPDDLWKRTLVRYPFLRRTDDPAAAELRRMSSLFLDRKEFHCTGGLKLTDAMAVAVAAQACLPILRLGLDRYDSFVGIVIHPDAVPSRQAFQDDDGVVHEYDDVRLGEAMERGPVQLAWPYVRSAGTSAAQGLNVVIHEFAHVLAEPHGMEHGVPLLPPDIALREWRETLAAELAAFVARVEADEPTALDPYGAEGEGEFFAVAAESFFVQAAQMQLEHPRLYDLFVRFFKQNPAQEQLQRRV